MQYEYNYSIIIPHYNIPDLLARCLRSIPEREDIQVIVVDDQSKDADKYLDTIPELHRKNVEFYIVDEKKGAGHARNIGLEHAKGEWLLFADSDDFFVKDFMSVVDSHKEDDSDLLYFNIKSCDCYKTDHIVDYDKSKSLNFAIRNADNRYLAITYTEPWGKMIKYSLVKNNNIFFQETLAHNDLLFSVKCGMLARNINIDNRPLYWYVFRDGSLGHQKGVESYNKLCDRIKAWDTTQNFLECQNVRVKIYLPVIPCLKVIMHDFNMYMRLLHYMKVNNMRYFTVIIDTIRYCLRRIFFHEKSINIAKNIVFK